MRRSPYPGVLLFPALLAACAAPLGSAPASGSGFPERAAAVAAAWPATPGLAAWETGFVPLQSLLVPPAGLTDEQRQAFDAGWFTLAGPLSGEVPSGEIAYPDGPEKAPLISADEAYRLIDQGDPPPCEPATTSGPGGRTAVTSDPQGPDAPVDDGPDGSISSGRQGACTELRVTDATLDTVPLRTSRGEADVPAWLFTLAGIPDPAARVAVADASITPVPSPTLAADTDPRLRSTQDLARVGDTTIDLRLGVGACDEQITASAHETDQVVVVGGTAVRGAEMCTEQLVIHPATVTLTAPVGTRPILDAQTGQPLMLHP